MILLFRAFAIFCIIAFAYTANAQQFARKIIRDTEIENSIRVLMQDIFKNAQINPTSVQFYLVDEQLLNAFVAGGQNIFINTGLLLQIDQPEELIGVLAHELGHIKAGHLARITDAQKRAQQIGLLTTAIGVPLAILSKNSDALFGAVAAGQSAGLGAFTSYTREMESEADQFALDILDKGQFNREKFGEFMKKLKSQEYLYGGDGTYFRTHPLTSERLNTIQNSITNADKLRKAPTIYQLLIERIKAKILAYQRPDEALQKYTEADSSLISQLARSIAFTRLNRLDSALPIAQNLVKNYPNDPFLWENLGDTQMAKGDYAPAEMAYNKALEYVPWASLILMQKANAIHKQQDKSRANDIISTLNSLIQYDDNAIEAYRMLGEWYNINGDKRASALQLAEAAYRTGEFTRADYFIKLVKRGPIDKFSQRADDISNEIIKMKKEIENQ